MQRLPIILLASALCFAPGCDDATTTPMPDMGMTTMDMGPTTPTAVPVCDREDLVIASIDLAADTVTILNPTSATITIDSSSPYQLCQGPGRYARLPAPSPVAIAPGATAVFDISGVSSIDLTETNGTLSLYSASSFTTRDAMIDFVCWGTGSGTPRLNIAQQFGSDNSVLWDDGGCVSLGGATELHRTAGSDGSTAADYTTTDPTLTCP